MTELRALLDLSTDLVRPRGLAGTALAAARRRRTRRRSAGWVAVAAVLVLVVAIGTSVGRVDRSAQPVAPTPAVADDTVRIDAAVAQPVFDPTTASRLPQTSGWALPADLAPRSDAPALTPGAAAVAAVFLFDTLHVFDAAGGQQQLDLPEPALPGGALAASSTPVALSPDGRAIAYAGRTRLWWRDLPGSWQSTDYPRDLDTAAEVSLELAMPDPQTLVVTGHSTDGDERGWTLHLDTGLSYSDPWLAGRDAVRGRDVHLSLRADRDRRMLALRHLDVARLTDVTGLGSLLHPVLAGDSRSFAAARETSTYSDSAVDHDGLLAATLDPVRVRAYLPVRDATESGYYGREGLLPLAWADDDHLLVRVVGPTAGIATLVSWDVGTGVLTRVSTAPPSGDLVVASQILLDP